MTASIQHSIQEKEIIQLILENKTKKKKWLKASNWLKIQMIKWEVENNNVQLSSLIIKDTINA